MIVLALLMTPPRHYHCPLRKYPSFCCQGQSVLGYFHAFESWSLYFTTYTILKNGKIRYSISIWLQWLKNVKACDWSPQVYLQKRCIYSPLMHVRCKFDVWHANFLAKILANTISAMIFSILRKAPFYFYSRHIWKG